MAVPGLVAEESDPLDLTEEELRAAAGALEQVRIDRNRRPHLAPLLQAGHLGPGDRRPPDRRGDQSVGAGGPGQGEHEDRPGPGRARRRWRRSARPSREERPLGGTAHHLGRGLWRRLRARDRGTDLRRLPPGDARGLGGRGGRNRRGWLDSVRRVILGEDEGRTDPPDRGRRSHLVDPRAQREPGSGRPREGGAGRGDRPAPAGWLTPRPQGTWPGSFWLADNGNDPGSRVVLGEVVLAPGLVDHDRDGVGQIEAAHAGLHRDMEDVGDPGAPPGPRSASPTDSGPNRRLSPASKSDVGVPGGARTGEGKHPGSLERRPATRLEVGMDLRRPPDPGSPCRPVAAWCRRG